MTIDINAETIEVLGYTLHRIKDDLDPFGDRRNPCWHVELEHMELTVIRILPLSPLSDDAPLWKVDLCRGAHYGGLAGFGETIADAADSLLEEIAKLSKWADEARKRGAQ